ncbi:MAG: L,D-transpeptidase family protein [Chlorobiaceae bacterium]|nr:L,D-transpeptidase family protein [Chlorobiaceae bacterium]
MTPILLLWFATLPLLNPDSSAPAGSVVRTQQYSPDPAVKEYLQNYLGRLDRLGASAGSDRASITGHMQRFYRAMGYRTAWTNRQAVARLVEVIEESAGDGLMPSDYHIDDIRKYYENPPESPALKARADLLMTDAVFTLMSHMRSGKVYPQSIEPDWNISVPTPGSDYDRTLMSAVMGSRFPELINGLRPSSHEYMLLRKGLARYRQIADEGGWANVPLGPMIAKEGDRDRRILAIRQRLVISGDLSADVSDAEESSASKPEADSTATASSAEKTALSTPKPDISHVYTAGLFDAVRSFQRRHGLTPDGIIGNETISAMNVPVRDRIEQIRLNLERYRWYLNTRGPNYVMVNIPSFTVDLVQNNVQLWHSRVIVGKPDLQTPVFRASIQYLILNPHWVIPPGILIKEVIPGIVKEPSYLSKRQLVVVDKDGKTVDSHTINWSHYLNGGFPYKIVQDSGDEGSLGRIKFMMPNRFMVYMHDTPSKELFEKSRRSFSHGCVRVDKPYELAEFLLKDPVKWNISKIEQAVNTEKTRTVNIPAPVPVFFLYQTAFADGDRVHFRADVYDRDPRLLKVLNSKASSWQVDSVSQ